MDIGDLIGKTHYPSLQSKRHPLRLMIQNTVPDLFRQIQPVSALFQYVHRPDALSAVRESERADPVQSPFSRMAERRVSQIMAQCNRLSQIFI